MTSAAIGTTSPKMPSAATVTKARWAVSSTACASRPNKSAPAHGTSSASHRLRGKHDCNVYSEDRGESRSGPAPGLRRRSCHRISSRNKLSSESSSARTSRSRIDSSRASRGSAVASSRARKVSIDEAVAARVEAHSADGVQCDQCRRQAPSVVGSHEHVPRPVVHRVTNRMVSACRCEPTVDEDDHALCQPFDLVQDVRADDHRPALRTELLEQCDEMQALDRIGAVQRFVEHEHVRIAHERGRDLGALAHALAERRPRRGRPRPAGRPNARPLRARADRRRRGGPRRSGRTGVR